MPSMISKGRIPPDNPSTGDIYMDDDNLLFHIWNGSQWVAFQPDPDRPGCIKRVEEGLYSEEMGSPAQKAI